ncbi:amino acid ABC transporter substrate-binding protein [Candidatus Dependentiae bacterium]|nr:MAG: amino acid ABC transporter substrate-binding protein [Candidatus Dependentiae bacterium]
MKRQAVSFFIIFAVFLGYYIIKQLRFSDQAKIENNNAIIMVGTNAEYKPFSFIDEYNVIVGFDIEVMNAVAQKLGLSVVYKDLPFEALIGELVHGNIDCMIGGINPTSERAKQVLFTDVLYANDPLVIVYKKDEVVFNTIQDLAGVKVIVNEGYFADNFLSNQESITLIRLSSNLPSDGLLALQNDQAKAFVGSKETTLQALTKKQQDMFAYTIIDEVVEQDAFAVSKNNKKLLADINKAIKELKKEGKIEMLVNKWFKTEPGT